MQFVLIGPSRQIVKANAARELESWPILGIGLTRLPTSQLKAGTASRPKRLAISGGDIRRSNIAEVVINKGKVAAPVYLHKVLTPTTYVILCTICIMPINNKKSGRKR